MPPPSSPEEPLSPASAAGERKKESSWEAKHYGSEDMDITADYWDGEMESVLFNQ